MKTFTTVQLAGASSLIRGLKLDENDTLLLLYQRDLTDASECIKSAARQVGVNVDAREFRREDFKAGYPESFSPTNLSRLNPQGIVLLIEWSELTTEARLDLLRDLKNHPQQWRIASMPGVDLEGFRLCNSDFDVIRDYSLIAFAALARSHSALLKTINPHNGTDELNIPIGSFLPILSTGEISAGSWGNFPSGETYIVPNKYKASGEITFRGSIPMYPLGPEEWVRSQIKRGRISYSSLEASSERVKELFTRLFFNSRGRPKCRNANAVAELGIGTNPGVTTLTGKPIFDEKMLGTVHVAFGSNTQFNGPLRSKVHHDIVCTGCSLTVINKYRSHALIEHGRFVMDRRTAVPQLDQFPPFEILKRRVELGNVQSHFEQENGATTLSIAYTAMGKDAAFRIATGSTASTAKDILERVRTHGRIKIPDLLVAQNVNSRSVLAGLLEYGLLKER